MVRKLAFLLGVGAVFGSPAVAQEQACNDQVEVDRFRYLRQLSLDLHNRVPTAEQLDALADEDEVSDAQIDAMLEDEAFYSFVRRHHSDLLWPSTEALDIVNAAFSLLLPAQFYYDSGDPQRLFLLYNGIFQRGGLVPCNDEPAEWDEEGNLIFRDYGDGTQREGYVMVRPYWAPDTEVKVCASEASLAPFANNGQPCDSVNGMATGTCGCGPGLQNCASIPVALDVVSALQEQLLRMVEAPIREGRPYTDMLTGKTEELNGPLVHYYRHLAAMAIDPIVLTAPVTLGDFELVDYGDREWKTYPRAHDLHSGLLTSMSFLLRFQTARARANRFHDAFLCEPFIAPPGSLPSPNDACSQEPNLRERCGCNACHSRLEPSAAWWGRFAEAGTMYIDPEIYPTYLARCAECARNPGRQCDFICQRFYVSEVGHPKQAPYAGVLKALEFRGPEEVEHVETGPSGFVAEAVEDGRLQRCVSHKLFTRLFHRAPTPEEQSTLIVELGEAFAASGYDFKALVKTLITHPSYRRMQR